MKIFARVMVAACLVIWTGIAAAQESSWVQIEARPSEAIARERAEIYAGRLDNVTGFRLGSGWYAVVLGPFSESDAEFELSRLRRQGAIPGDSFLSDGANFSNRFFGSEDEVAAISEPAEPLPPLVAGEETLSDARASERLLDRDGRALLQTALKWEGFYTSTIDASFGPGTRRAMSAWQEDRRYEPTGVLTTLQRRELVGAYQDALAALDMRQVADALAGVDISLPVGLVGFDRYEPPFAHYEPVGDSGVKVLLIS